MGESILLLGASVRAAAQSCRRAGYDCYGADLFADQDTTPLGGFARIKTYPYNLLEIAQKLPSGPWMYTGALENYPDLVDEISQHRPLLGIGGDSLRRVRDPLLLHELLQREDLPTPQTTCDAMQLAPHRNWLRKPRRSAGGMNIEWFTGDDVLPKQTTVGDHYYQEYISGTPVAAVFVGCADGVQLFGVTRQLIGVEWTGITGFRYAGSIGPWAVGEATLAQIQRSGDVVGQAFGLRGLFGLDGIIRDGQFWTVEVNPRYSASVEVLERATGDSAIARHVAAFQTSGVVETRPSVGQMLHAKAIVFADREIYIGETFQKFVEIENRETPEPLVADIPRSGEVIETGHPIATVFASGMSEMSVLEQLQQRSERLNKSLDEPGGSGTVL